MTPQSRFLILILLAAPVAAFAGGTATVQSGSGHQQRTTIEWRDAHTLRMQGTKKQQFILLRDGKTYMVMSRNGKPTVIDVTSMKSTMNASGKDKGIISGSFKPTGKTETVAGIKGHVYHATWTDAMGKHKGDAVLTDNQQAVELTQAYMTLIDAFSAENDAAAKLHLPKSEPGLLRLGNDFRVLSISDKTPPSKDFKLPAKPTSLADMMKRGSGSK
ncbi:MAG TPA: hypothetical protein VFK24_02535 [Gammaproteobacteria bacterium]|nr:hypothetical protein [Gammaproteobacteria bacterium]